MRFYDRLERALFPWDLHCLSCPDENPGEFVLCDKCRRELQELTGPRCPVCLDRVAEEGLLCAACLDEKPAYEALCAGWSYDGLIRDLIRRMKFEDAAYLRHPFSDMAISFLPPDWRSAADFLVPVPLTKKRRFERGYNQAALIAREIGKKTGLAVREDLLKRTDNESALSRKNRAERKKTVGTYVCAPLHGETVLLLDDVVTTGTTVRACAKALKKAGAGRILVLALARTDKKI